MTSSMHEHFTGNSVGNRPMKVADGYFTLRVPDMSDSVWARAAPLIGATTCSTIPALRLQPRAGSTATSWRRYSRASASGRTRQQIWDGLRELDYFGAPVLSVGEVIEDLHIKERRAFVERDHPTAGRTTLLAPWIHLSKTPTAIHHDAPAIGQHTDEVLGALGVTTADLADLREQGVIK